MGFFKQSPSVKAAKGNLKAADGELHAYQRKLEREGRTIDESDATYRRLNGNANRAANAVKAAKRNK